MEFKKTNGLIAAPFTPMNKDHSVNLSPIKNYAQKLKADNVKGVFVCGTTGEGMLMTESERIAVLEKWLEQQEDDFKVMAHVGSTSQQMSYKLAKHAGNSGAAAVACMGPSFLKPDRIEELVQFCAGVAAGAPNTPFYYYHIPSVSGVDFNMKDFIIAAKEEIPTLAGIKYTHNNFVDLIQCVQIDNGRFDMLSGFDELLLAALSYGVKGAVGSTYNYIAPHYCQLINDFEKGNLVAARQKQLLSVRVIELLNKYGGAIAAGKALMKSFGVDCGPCRLPLRSNEDIDSESIYKEIRQLGVV
jgi:N-acetylneuraminate lyase